MFSKFEYDGKLNPTFVEGAFELPLSSIRTYIKDPICPRFNNSFPLDLVYYYFYYYINAAIICLLGGLSALDFLLLLCTL